MSLNKKCPLCKQDFRGKEYEDDDSEEDEEEEEERLNQPSFEEIPMSQFDHTTGNNNNR